MYHYYYVVCSRSVARCDYTHFRLMILFVFNWHTHMFNNTCILLNILHAGRRRTFYVYSGRGSVERCGHLWLWSYRAEEGGTWVMSLLYIHDSCLFYRDTSFGSGPTAQKGEVCSTIRHMRDMTHTLWLPLALVLPHRRHETWLLFHVLIGGSTSVRSSHGRDESGAEQDS